MKSVILAFLIAAGVNGFSSSSNAQAAKKPPHPAAAADQALQKRGLDLPASNATHPGEASPGSPKPTTGDPVASGAKSTADSKTK